MRNMYTAPSTTPASAAPPAQRLAANAPSRIRNSPTKPFSPGRPMDDSSVTRKTVANTGIRFHSPPYSPIRRVWRRS